MQGHTQVLLVCFGLRNTTARLRELGLSRLASDHERSIGVLDSGDAKRAVVGTLEAAFSGFVFDDGTVNETRRTHWIGASVDAILHESGNFPHHLANGCRSLARIVLDEGIGVEPPVHRLQEECRKRKRDYYDARLHPWRRHTVALSYAFPGGSTSWTSIEDVVAVLMAADNFGRPVAEDVAVAIVEELSANGFVEEHMTGCRLALPSLESHFKEMQLGVDPRSKASQAVRAVRADLGNPEIRLALEVMHILEGIEGRCDGERTQRACAAHQTPDNGGYRSGLVKPWKISRCRWANRASLDSMPSGLRASGRRCRRSSTTAGCRIW